MAAVLVTEGLAASRGVQIKRAELSYSEGSGFRHTAMNIFRKTAHSRNLRFRQGMFMWRVDFGIQY
jgi:hypothetical protein